ncbi:DNA repair protein RecN [Compostibacter hankyongensis]|uniref:DNA repair protein RecN n=1 Tax=Compostibacter hankyongensis TaxID=1007089 RepID=A0ABP8FY82_9BACT
MLQRLLIQNYAIITALEIDFSEGLNVITGETGAGKSILLGALSLILGERADRNVLHDKARKCIIEGHFVLPELEAVTAFFGEHDLDFGRHTVVRREISTAGKSRAFINDTPVTVQQLSGFAGLLVDLHQQFDTLELGKQDFQRAVLDALAGHDTLLARYHESWKALQQAGRELEERVREREQAEKERDYRQFLWEELDAAALKENELEELDAELNTLSHAEEVKERLGILQGALEEGEQPLVQQLRQLQSGLRSIEAFHPQLPGLAERLQVTAVEVQDIAGELQRVYETVQSDPERMALINERTALGYRLLKKHGVQTTAALLQIQAGLGEQLDQTRRLETDIEALEREKARLQQQAERQAEQLTAGRKKQAAPFEQRVNALLAQVGMPNASLKVSLMPAPLQTDGQDHIDFLFDANRSGHYQPLKKVASGGELSRLMLCVKSLVAQSMELPTLIFDEIDSGISGEAAKQTGVILKKLADRHQVICITHQPQIAGKGDAHYFVYKAHRSGQVTTHIRLLDKEERILQIARMLSGEKPSAAALENARELVEG